MVNHVSILRLPLRPEERQPWIKGGKVKGKNASIIEMARVNIITGCVLILFSLFAILWLIPAYTVVQDDVRAALSPRLFPYITATSLLILSAILLITNLLKLRRPGNLVPEESEENEVLGFGVKEGVNCLVLAAGAGIYMLLLKHTGFVIASSLMIAVSMYISHNRGIVLPLVALGFPWAMKLFFWYALEVPLP